MFKSDTYEFMFEWKPDHEEEPAVYVCHEAIRVSTISLNADLDDEELDDGF